ncbi:hypothetical protein MZO42_15535 [Sphingomonas psychrotolerans]|uniref:Uncharacterized protein n=1 Tax=Sphingomonas psychrotolerans TaxID=1327635 RepID=A0ABU3N8I6_9SPHN|nr:hypothetical protein [Sphingomonas psychrotolerans]MDT8760112.1 hypothetical protein [Sphingomonas psychrotolerans]
MPLGFFLVMMFLQQGAGTPTPAANLAGDRLAPLVAVDGRYCTADARWCVSLDGGGEEGAPAVPTVRPGDAAAPAPGPADETSDESYAVWPGLVLLKGGGFLAGVEVRTSTAYSGGGGSATELRLFRISAGGHTDAKPVLTVPVGASLMIRACFSEADMKSRRGACHDEYSFAGSIALAQGATAGLPDLSYDTEARTYPRGVSRLEDSTGKGRLKKSDLVRARDPACSFVRRFRFDSATSTYLPDRPLPDCSAYTVP